MRNSVVGVVVRNSHVLVGKKVRDGKFLSDSWHLPGGGIEAGETPEDAVKREIFEETGLEVIVERLLDESVLPDLDTVLKWYLCASKSPDPQPGGDLVDARFVPIAEVAKFCSPEAVRRWPKGVIQFFETFR